jgi:hypothetical protein
LILYLLIVKFKTLNGSIIFIGDYTHVGIFLSIRGGVVSRASNGIHDLNLRVVLIQVIDSLLLLLMDDVNLFLGVVHACLPFNYTFPFVDENHIFILILNCIYANKFISDRLIVKYLFILCSGTLRAFSDIHLI